MRSRTILLGWVALLGATALILATRLEPASIPEDPRSLARPPAAEAGLAFGSILEPPGMEAVARSSGLVGEGFESAYRGRVLGNGDGHAQGVRVEIGVVDGARSAVLAHEVSDRTGGFAGSVRIPAEFADLEDARLFARIEGEGYGRRRAHSPIRRMHGTTEFHLTILGAGLKGRVVNAEGAPVRGASVELRTDGLAGVDAGATSDREGRFEILWARPGSFRLNARARGEGCAEIQPVVLATDVEHEELEIRLLRDDRLAGRIEDTEGRPLEGVEIWAFPPYLAGRSEESLFLWRQGTNASSPRGERSGACTSGPGGSFLLEGLEPGNYWLSPADELAPGSRGTAAYTTGDADIVLVVGRWWLELAPPSSGEGVLFCAGLHQGGADSRLAPVGPGDSSGTQVFAVEGGRTYVCGWMDSAHAIREERVTIPWSRPRTRLEVQSGEAIDPGTLDLSILTLDREDEQRARTVGVFSIESGVELWRWTQGSASGPQELSAGAYRLHVRIDPVHGFRDGTPGFESLLVDERRIEILPGRTTRIQLWR